MATATKTTNPASAKATAGKKNSPKKATSDVFAIIATGGKQYQVSVGESVQIEKIEGLKKGDSVSFDKALLVDNGTDTTIGTPYITGASVSGEVEVVGRAQKVMVIKYKQKSRYQKKNGHRQPYLKVKILAIK